LLCNPICIQLPIVIDFNYTSVKFISIYVYLLVCDTHQAQFHHSNHDGHYMKIHENIRMYVCMYRPVTWYFELVQPIFSEWLAISVGNIAKCIVCKAHKRCKFMNFVISLSDIIFYPQIFLQVGVICILHETGDQCKLNLTYFPQNIIHTKHTMYVYCKYTYKVFTLN